MSHTGSLAGSSQIWEGLFRQCGIIEASGVDEVCDVILALNHLGRNPGRRLLVSGGGGGLGTYAADLAEREGLAIPPLEAQTLTRMQKILNRAGAVASNPLDIGAPLIPPPAFDDAMLEAARNPSTDMLVFDLAMNFAYRMAGDEGLDRAADVLARVSREAHKPAVVVLYSRAIGTDDLVLEKALRRTRDRLMGNGIPVYPSMRRALRAISLVNS
jgi:acyl-CoA synthetase (NDP forming)